MAKKEMTPTQARKLHAALSTMLVTAERNLLRSTDKNSAWDIEHYTGHVNYIRSEIAICDKAISK